jgi:hypothetical protein
LLLEISRRFDTFTFKYFEHEQELVSTAGIVANLRERVLVGIADTKLFRDLEVYNSAKRSSIVIDSITSPCPEFFIEQEVGSKIYRRRSPVSGFHQEGRFKLGIGTDVKYIAPSKVVTHALNSGIVLIIGFSLIVISIE